MTTNHSIPDSVSNAGLEFSYAGWTADTELTLSRVSWDSTYRDTWGFDTAAQLDAYIDSKATTTSRIKNASYARANAPVRISMRFNDAIRYNYLRARNPIDGRSFYYFILDVQHIAPDTTQLIVQLDIWCSFHGFKITRAYVERGHIAMANEKQFEFHGRRYLTVPEGMETGSDMVVVRRDNRPIMGNGMKTTGGGSADTASDMRVRYLIASTIELNKTTFGDVKTPGQQAATGTRLQNQPNGVAFYVAEGSDGILALMASLKDFPWIARGIISITALPGDQANSLTLDTSNSPVAGVYKVSSNIKEQKPGSFSFGKLGYWRENAALDYIPPRYKKLKKLLTYPYCAIEIGAWNSTSVTLRPENWQSGTIDMATMASYLPGAQRYVVYPRLYNTDETAVAIGGGVPLRDPGEFLNSAIVLTNFPSLMVANDNAALAQAMSANSLSFQGQSADWAQQKAMTAAQTGYDQSTLGINANIENSNNAMNTAQATTNQGNYYGTQQAALGAGMGMVNGIQGGPAGLLSGSIGALGGAVSNAMSVNNSNAMNTISQGSMRRSQEISTGLSSGIRDSNFGMASWAARGDYANTIAGIQASMQDTRMAPPSTVGQLGGDMLNAIYGLFEINATIRMIDKASIARIGEYWLRYGYSVNEFIQNPPIHCMTKFTYWKMVECYIEHETIPETYRLGIRGIFEKGVTVHKDPNAIGKVDPASNEAIGGITYG